MLSRTYTQKEVIQSMHTCMYECENTLTIHTCTYACKSQTSHCKDMYAWNEEICVYKPEISAFERRMDACQVKCVCRGEIYVQRMNSDYAHRLSQILLQDCNLKLGYVKIQLNFDKINRWGQQFGSHCIQQHVETNHGTCTTWQLNNSVLHPSFL